MLPCISSCPYDSTLSVTSSDHGKASICDLTGLIVMSAGDFFLPDHACTTFFISVDS